jgi:hypothetical protein
MLRKGGVLNGSVGADGELGLLLPAAHYAPDRCGHGRQAPGPVALRFRGIELLDCAFHRTMSGAVVAHDTRLR